MNEWSISQAKENFSRIIASSEESPQIIRRRGKPVSAVIPIQLFNELMSLRDKTPRPTIAELLEELKGIQESDPVDLEVPERWDRPNPFEDEADEMDL
ncbi:MAG: type II toxin-antitoxin system Phd/YefM family antitoxin [Desulfococcaceae bacterium]